jgi:hypothetical protein
MRAVPVAVVACAIALVSVPAVGQSENLARNSGFEQPLAEEWHPIWTREPEVATVSRVGGAHSGSCGLRIEHSGPQDWCMTQASRVPVSEGDIFELSGWVKCTDLRGEANFSVVTRDAADQVMDWIFGAARTSGTHGWEQVQAHFVVPRGCATIELRLVGHGPGVIWFDDVLLIEEGNVADRRGPAEDIRFGNELVDVVFDTGSGTFTVTDKRLDAVYRQLPVSGLPVVMEAATGADGTSLTATLWDASSDLRLALELRVPPGEEGAGLRCELRGAGALSHGIVYPAPFATQKGTLLVVPVNEGILFPADDDTVEPLSWLPAYSGHGICMAWFGQCQGETGRGVMGIIETPDDARLGMDRPKVDGNSGLCLWPIWEPSRGEFAYTRAVTYTFLPSGGYVSQAKRYRDYAKQTGLYKSLRTKRAQNPNVDLLIGAVNVWAPAWYGNAEPLGLVDEMQSLGIERLIYSEGTSAETVAALNSRPGVLSSRYDIYQDVWPPDKPPNARHEGWPEDLVLLPDGSIMQGWVIRSGNTEYPGGVICSSRGLRRAREQVRAELATHPYRCRFIDTTTASPWRECHNPDHPLSRTEDRHYKMELLRFCSEEMGLVTGTETGIDPSVPYVHYYEGMLSLGPYRLPDSGYTMIEYKTPTPEFLKYQVGHYYRVPLWELVYHDCVVSQWYWGDSSNKAPEVWDQRDLLNLLYGTPPLFMLSPDMWVKHKDRFAQSYRAVCPTARALGYDEMLSHEFLTADHTLQRTVWSSGTSVVVNFGDTAQALPDGSTISPMGSIVAPAP